MKIQLRNTSFYCKSFILYLFICKASVLFAQPVANFSATPITGCAPLVVTFSDLSTGSPTSWLWDLGNGTTSTQQNPTTTYFTPGLYTVSLIATNATGSNTFTRTQYIRVDDRPTVDFSATNTSGCFPLRVNFTDLSVGNTSAITNWEWDFGDGGTSISQNPSHVYTRAGNYAVTLRVTNAGGCFRVVSKVNFVQVPNGVIASFVNTAPTLCQPPESINFTNLSTGPGTLSYQWFFGDGGTSTSTNPSNNYLTGGSFNVTLITTSSLGCVDTLVRTAAVVIKNVTSDFTGPATVCQGAPATFVNTSSVGVVSVLWDFGDATTSTDSTPTKIYTAPGTYNVTLTNDYGTCTNTVVKPITVFALPTANFIAPDTTDCNIPFTVNFADASAGAVSWAWNFGDGGTSTAQNPSHTYTALGRYTVTLIVTNSNGCTDTLVRNQYVQIEKPVVAINNLPIEGCVPFTINPTPNVTAPDGVASYFWDFGDGFTSTLQNPTHTYPTQGNYNVKLRITTVDGCTDSITITNAVVVGNRSIANFTALPLAQCVGQPVQFTNLTTLSDRWSWDFGDGIGISTLENPSYIYQDTGLFTIKLIATNNGCPDSLIRTNYITALPPVARFGYTVGCVNKLQVVFADSSVLPQTWFWDFGDGTPTSTAQNPTHTYAAFGNYNVSLTVTNGGCSNTKIIPISLFNEVPNFTIIDDTICTTQDAVFVPTGINPANVMAYEWDFGDGVVVTLPSATNSPHRYSAAGLYSVSLTIIDRNGCRITTTKNNVLRVWGPYAYFNYNPITGCKPANITFVDGTITDGTHNITNWLWDFGDGTSQNFTAPPFTHLYDTSGNFITNLTVTDSYGCTSKFFNNTPIYISNPKANFRGIDSLTCPGTNVNFTSSSVGVGLTYLWDFGDGTTSTLQNPTKTYATNNDFTVKLVVTDSTGCQDSLVKTNYIISHAPIPSIGVNDSISSCSPFEVNFVNTSQYWRYNVWNFGDGTPVSLLEKPTHYYTTPGTYVVWMVLQGFGNCVDSVSKTIILYPDTARLTYTPLSGCSPLAVSFNVSTPGPVTYLWDFNDGTTLATTDSSIIYNYLLPGTFLPKVILEDQTGCQIPIQGIDSIYVTKSDVNFGADDTLHCNFGIVNFTDSTISNRVIASYNWNFGDGGTSNLQNPQHTYTTPGLYTVQLIVSTADGCSDTLTKPNYIAIVASPNVAITGNIPICMKSPISFRGVIIVPDTLQIKWAWSFGNGNSSISQNPLPQRYDTAGNYPLQLIVSNSSGCADTLNQIVVIYPLPTIDAGPDQTIIVSSSFAINPTGSPVVDYLWTPAYELSCTACYNTIASPKNTTTYTIKVTDANGCINKDDITIFVTCNDKNIFIPNTFTPNNDGVNDWFYPRGTGLFKIQSMRIFNRWGQMVYQKNDLFPNDQFAGWNGRYNGKLQVTDVYTYIIEIICDNSQVLTYKGNISLIQ